MSVGGLILQSKSRAFSSHIVCLCDPKSHIKSFDKLASVAAIAQMADDRYEYSVEKSKMTIFGPATACLLGLC